MTVISEISAADTHPLRRSVLRVGTASHEVVWDGDDLPTTFHLGARTADGELMAISTWLERRHPSRPDDPAFRLRGMATAPFARGTGIGAALLRAGIAECERRTADVVWARARLTAVAFYERHGFAVVGDEYIDEATGLCHIDIVRRLDG